MRDAIARDSSDADAWYGYADALWHHRVDGWGTPKTVANWTRALRAFKRTLAIDSTYFLAYAHTLDLLNQAASPNGSLMLESDSLWLVDSAVRHRPEVVARLAASRERAFTEALRVGRGWTRAAPSPTAYRGLYYLFMNRRLADSAVALMQESAARPEARSARTPFMLAMAEGMVRPASALPLLRRALREVKPEQLSAEGGHDVVEMLLSSGRSAALAGSLRDTDSLAALATRVVRATPGPQRDMARLPRWWALGVRAGGGVPYASLRAPLDSMIGEADRLPGDAGQQRRKMMSAGLYTVYLATRDARYLATYQRWSAGQPAFGEVEALQALVRGDEARARSLAAKFPSADSMRAARAPLNAVRWVARAQVLEQLGDARGAIAMYAVLDPALFTTMGIADPAASLYARSYLRRAALHETLGEQPAAEQAWRQVPGAHRGCRSRDRGASSRGHARTRTGGGRTRCHLAGPFVIDVALAGCASATGVAAALAT